MPEQQKQSDQQNMMVLTGGQPTTQQQQQLQQEQAKLGGVPQQNTEMDFYKMYQQSKIEEHQYNKNFFNSLM